jgi:phosphopantothenoylcysteine decarboxylase / phosphopantothenate---cysteine ligase
MSMDNHPSKDIVCSSSDSLAGKRIALGICGSVGAVTCVELARLFMRHGAEVYPVMSEASCGIIHPDLMEWATGNKAVVRLTGAIEHVALAGNVEHKIDLFLIAPATANTIGKIASGIDDTPVTTTATTAIGEGIPLLIVPAMHEPMWRHPVVNRNISALKAMGIEVMLPRIEEGKAKIAEPEAVFYAALGILLKTGAPLSGKHLAVSAGRTVEYIDPVRVISNNASGRMGMSIAKAALLAGARVTVLSGKVAVPAPPGVNLISCDTAESLLSASRDLLKNDAVDIYVAAAAVGDWRCSSISKAKISTHEKQELPLMLEPTPKILDGIKHLSPDTFVVAFRALHNVTDTEMEQDALLRMKKAQADMIAVNDVGEEGAGFETETNRLQLFFPDGERKVLPFSSKDTAARMLLREAALKMNLLLRR